MAQGTVPPEPPSPSDGADPFALLGIDREAGFELVQQAREARLAALSPEDALGRARIDAAYDAVLMLRLRERQLGQLTGAAATASKREAVPSPAGGGTPTLPVLAALPNLPRPGWRLRGPTLALASGPQLWQPLAGLGGLLLALATLGCALALNRRSGRFFPSIGWAFALLTLGLVLGGLLALPLSTVALPLSAVQWQGIPAFLLLLLGSLLLA
jgi:Protein CHAPERONE-LIKE PROTEIN OF POR1-like